MSRHRIAAIIVVVVVSLSFFIVARSASAADENNSTTIKDAATAVQDDTDMMKERIDPAREARRMNYVRARMAPSSELSKTPEELDERLEKSERQKHYTPDSLNFKK